MWVGGGRLRLQSCTVTSKSSDCVAVEGGDPVLVSCK